MEGVTLTYQWYKYDEEWDELDYLLKGETTKTLKLSNVQESAVYCCCVGNGTITAKLVFCYVDVEKENIDTGLKLEKGRYIKYIAAGSDVAFEVKASVKEGCGEISYQWYDSDFNELEGQNTAVLHLTNVQESAIYYCGVSDIAGKKMTADCFIYVNESGLVIDATTVSKTVPLGATVKLEVKASVNDGYSIDYEWWKYEGGDTVTLDGENAGTLILSNVQEAGAYCCQVHVSGSMKSISVYFDVDVEEEQHTHTWSDWQVIQAATYTTTGLQTRSCTGCDAEETAEIARVTIPTPTLVSAAETLGKSITVTWNAVNGIDGYEVYRKTAGADWAQLAEVSSDTTSYVDSNATAGIEYIYTVKAYCNNGSEKIYGGYDEAGKSATVVAVHEHSWGAWEVTKAATYTTTGLQTRSCTGCDAKETAEIARVTIPTLTLVSASATAEKTITFTWNAVSGIDGYYVYRKVAGGKWKRLANLSSDKASYVDSGVTAGTAYIYTVKAYCNNGSEKIYGSYDAAGKTVTAVAKAATPTLVSAKATAGNTITFKWKAVSGVDGYRVYRKKAGGSYKALANVSAGVTSYADKTAKAGVSYTYTVRAYNTVNGSKLLSYYTAAGKTATAKAKAPTISSVKALGSRKVEVSWESVSGVNGYRVYRKTAGGSWKAIKTVSSKTTSYTDKTAKAGVKYYYTVRAYNTVNGSKLLGFYNKTGKAVTAK